jgi:HEPN domain-containing protein
VVENSIKAVISLFKPVPKVHELDELVDDLIKELDFELEYKEKLRKLKEYAKLLGFEEHIKTDYGDEVGRLTPWELFDKDDAVESLQIARDSFEIAKSLKEKFKENSKGYTALH